MPLGANSWLGEGKRQNAAVVRILQRSDDGFSRCRAVILEELKYIVVLRREKCSTRPREL